MKDLKEKEIERVYANSFKFSCEQLDELNDTVVKSVEVSYKALARTIEATVVPLVKTDIFKTLEYLNENLVDIKIDHTNAENEIIATSVNSKFEMIEYYFGLEHSRVSNDNLPLYITIIFREV